MNRYWHLNVCCVRHPRFGWLPRGGVLTISSFGVALAVIVGMLAARNTEGCEIHSSFANTHALVLASATVVLAFMAMATSALHERHASRAAAELGVASDHVTMAAAAGRSGANHSTTPREQVSETRHPVDSGRDALRWRARMLVTVSLALTAVVATCLAAAPDYFCLTDDLLQVFCGAILSAAIQILVESTWGPANMQGWFTPLGIPKHPPRALSQAPLQESPGSGDKGTAAGTVVQLVPLKGADCRLPQGTASPPGADTPVTVCTQPARAGAGAAPEAACRPGVDEPPSAPAASLVQPYIGSSAAGLHLGLFLTISLPAVAGTFLDTRLKALLHVLMLPLFVFGMISWAVGFARLNCPPSRFAKLAGCLLHGNCCVSRLQCITRPVFVYRTAPLTEQAAAVYVGEARSLLRALWLAEAACGLVAPIAYFRATSCSIRVGLSLANTTGLSSSLFDSTSVDNKARECSTVLAGVEGAEVLRSAYAALLVGALVMAMFVAMFSWGGTVSALAVMRRREQQQQADTLLRWLSHECRSPVQAAMLQLTSMQEEHVEDFAVLRQRRLGRGAAGAGLPPPDHSTSEQLPEQLAAVNTTLKSLGDILDNMLAFMRQRHTTTRSSHGQQQQLSTLDAATIWATAWRNAAAVGSVDSENSAQNITLSAKQVLLGGASLEHVQGVGSTVLSAERGTGHAALAPMLELQRWGIRSTVSSSTMQQVLTNLLSNALKYGQRRSQRGGRHTDISVELTLMRYSCPSHRSNASAHGQATLDFDNGVLEPVVSSGSGISDEEDEEGLGGAGAAASPDSMFRGVHGAYNTQDLNGVPYVLPVLRPGRSMAQTLPHMRPTPSCAGAAQASSVQDTLRRAVRMARRQAVQRNRSWVSERTLSDSPDAESSSPRAAGRVGGAKLPPMRTNTVEVNDERDSLPSQGDMGVQAVLLAVPRAALEKQASLAVQPLLSLHTPDAAEASCVPAVLSVTVSDAGDGMSWDEAQTLFQPFRRLRHGGAHASRGTGLGLWLMKELVVPQGGALEVTRAARRQGCTFRLLLPVVVDAVQAPSGAAAGPGLEQALGGTRLPGTNNTDPLSAGSRGISGLEPIQADLDSRHSFDDSLTPRMPHAHVSIRTAGCSQEWEGLTDAALSETRVQTAAESISTAGSQWRPEGEMGASQRSDALFGGEGILVLREGGTATPVRASSAPRNHSGNAGVPPRHAQLLGTLRVLLVDDDHTLRKLVAKRLRRWGVGSVAVASDGLEAWEEICGRWEGGEGGGQFHAVITDETMPKMLGSELCTKVRQGASGRQLPCQLLLAVTGNGMPEDIAHLKSAGAHSVFSKPLQESLLVDELCRLAESLERERALLRRGAPGGH